MSVLWEHFGSEGHYSVRQAGHSIRLYSDGVFHSQWNPRRPFAGGIWDCLSLPVLYRSAESIQRILVLGLGGGAVVQQLRRLLPEAHITAIEIDPIHLDIAQRWFGLNELDRLELIEADAIGWLHQHDNRPFDLLIDDLFTHTSGEPVRAQPVNELWARQLLSQTTPGGLVHVNGIESGELRDAAAALKRAGAQTAVRWSLPSYENAVGVFSTESLEPKQWQQNLERSPLGAEQRRAACAPRRRKLY